MESIITFFSSYFTYWPLVCFFALLLAGLNLPISEDVLIVMSALIAYEDHSQLIPNYLGLYAGIYGSDIISYWMGRLLGEGVLKFKFITKALSPSKREFLSKKLEKHGFLTFIVVRFIPFGMRNALFMTSGLTKLPFPKFLLFDGIAAIISSMTLYSLVLFIGESAKEGFKIVGIILFIILWGLIIAFIIKKVIDHKKKKKAALMQASAEASGEGSEELKKAE
ncbi:MAG: DedA family protein [Spirochaetaceae bacterium]|nr:DedA family protein [Spirochaetaceae bacterium]